MATHSSKASDSRKPTKPYDDFPLTPRADGRWCKRINGKLELFIGDWKDAFDEYDRCKAALRWLAAGQWAKRSWRFFEISRQ